MRLPVTPPLATKEGISNKNARMTNVLKETSGDRDLGVVRPGLEISSAFPGLGNGLVDFDGKLLTVFDDTVYLDDYYWPIDSVEWVAGTTYNFGDFVWYLGDLWFSLQGGNTGNTPTGGAWWSSHGGEYLETVTYAIGDRVLVDGVLYYACISNIGKPPLANPDYWKNEVPGAGRYQVTSVSFNGVPLGTGPIAASMNAAAAGAYALVPYLTCTNTVAGIWSSGRAPINEAGSVWYANSYYKNGCTPQAPGITSIGRIYTV